MVFSWTVGVIKVLLFSFADVGRSNRRVALWDNLLKIVFLPAGSSYIINAIPSSSSITELCVAMKSGKSAFMATHNSVMDDDVGMALMMYEDPAGDGERDRL
jgi:hypothetical protein